MTGEARKIRISISSQKLELLQDGVPLKSYTVSTAANGPGELNASECTPRGKHYIRLKIGENCPLNTVFIRRRPTGEIYSEALAQEMPGRDWVLTRILWLSGSEQGINRGGERDTLRRFIYIHGTPESEPLGKPASHGCIRMNNNDILELFEACYNGMPVDILV